MKQVLLPFWILGVVDIPKGSSKLSNGIPLKFDEYQDSKRRNPETNSIALFYQMQNMFLRNSLMHMKHENRTWVILNDSDEYIQFNGKEGEISQVDGPTADDASYPESSLYRMVVPGISYPSMQEKGSIYKFLKYLEQQPQPIMPSNHPLWNVYAEERRKHGNCTVFLAPCIHIPRRLFGAIESTRHEQSKMVPNTSSSSSSSSFTSLSPSLLSTLRYRKHMNKAIAATEQINGWAKVIMDVSRIPWEDFPTLQDAWELDGVSINVHRPVPKHCPRPYFSDGGAASLFRINHYVGSWEAYDYRLDARVTDGRNKTTWEEKALIQDETDDNIRPWLQGLVQEEGLELAGEMLRMAELFTPKERRLE